MIWEQLYWFSRLVSLLDTAGNYGLLRFQSRKVTSKVCCDITEG